MPELVAVGVEIGVELLEKVVPKGLAWIRAKFFGERIIAVGEPRAGKTNFVGYLAYGVLFPEEHTERTEKERNTTAFDLAVGRDRALRITVSKAIDTSGHSSVKDQVKLLNKRRPNVLLIFLDGSKTWTDDGEEGIGYLTRFLEELNTRCLRNPGLAKALKYVAVVLNKVDLIDDAEIKVRLRNIRQCLNSFKSPNWGGTAANIGVYHCIAIEHAHARRLLDHLIKSMMKIVVQKNG